MPAWRRQPWHGGENEPSGGGSPQEGERVHRSHMQHRYVYALIVVVLVVAALSCSPCRGIVEVHQTVPLKPTATVMVLEIPATSTLVVLQAPAAVTPVATDIPADPAPTAVQQPADTPAAVVSADEAPSFEQMCKRNKSLTDVQFTESLKAVVGKKLTDRKVWVYDVYGDSGGYKVLLASEPPGGLFWSRDIEAYGIPDEIATKLSKEQPVRLSGTIREVGLFLGTACNPIDVENATIVVE